MTNNRTTVNISKEAHRAAKEDKREGESWDEWMQRKADETEVDDPVDTISEVVNNKAFREEVPDREALAEDRQEQLEEVISGMCGDHATEESIGELADTLREVKNRIDDLEAQLPRKVAEEVRNS